jgi:hypothetical protein
MIQARIANLWQMLRAAQASPQSEPEKARSVVGNVLIRTIDLIQELWPEDPTLARPFQELLYELKSLDHGLIGRLFVRSGLSGRAPHGIQDVLVRSRICAAMTCLVQGGTKRQEASRLLHGKLHKMGFEFPQRINKVNSRDTFRPGAQFEKWRERVMEQVGAGNIADKSYRDALELVKGLAPNRAVQVLLDITKSCHPKHFPTES